jgi:hypothetical protein
MSRANAIRVVFAVLAVGFFVAPIAARVAGVTAEEFENRRFAESPRLSQGWDAFGQATRYLTDRMPLRAQAVRANTRIWTDLFDTDPIYARDKSLDSDQALPFAGGIEQDGGLRVENGGLRGGPATAKTGRGGWLYVPIELESACDDSVSNRQLLKRWSTLIRTLRAGGRDSELFVVPHKASVYPEYLPDKYRFKDCALPAKERLWRMLSKEGPALGVHELRSELLRLKPTAGDALFQRKDMHWTTLGALTLIDAALDALGDGVELKPSEIVARGSVPYTGDLSLVGGNAKTDTRDEYGIVRAHDAPRVPGRTAIVCDSFAYKWFRLFKPYFEHVRYTTWYRSTNEVVDTIRWSDRVIVEADEIALKVGARRGEKVAQILSALRR